MAQMVRVKVYITFKKGILDPQGETVAKALKALGFDEVKKARVGKYILLELEDGERVEERVKAMCERLLANPVIEDYTFKIES